ncbi:arsenite efflux transporter metallochaperone ArsD [Alkalicoccus chagannorensis]|uniref:arsenite efflux transporter metallochaperone ArsD n=1 Tax=Alkalicoccus chagannorensis TaxID=427072 RepID=UPI000406BF7D|nr:arsenite efflux transporter metallochaperone ArsD [Alkalicoccus chagannorensis]
MKIEIFDPALCCSTGVCGTDVDPALTKMAKLHTDLQKSGVDVNRYNLAQEPGAFVENKTVQQFLEEKGADALPVVLVDGEQRLEGRYPTKQDAAAWTGRSEEDLTPKEPKNQISLN